MIPTRLLKPAWSYATSDHSRPGKAKRCFRGAEGGYLSGRSISGQFVNKFRACPEAWGSSHIVSIETVKTNRMPKMQL
ncbi:MAG TPA: hypothetical protein V6D07_07870 [Trichocoleus sp.]